MITAFDAPLDLAGVVAGWVWDGGTIPVGVSLDHADHSVLVCWAVSATNGVEAADVFTLESLVPLTVVEPVLCSLCGTAGRIEAGAWAPAVEGGVQGG